MLILVSGRQWQLLINAWHYPILNQQRMDSLTESVIRGNIIKIISKPTFNFFFCYTFGFLLILLSQSSKHCFFSSLPPNKALPASFLATVQAYLGFALQIVAKSLWRKFPFPSTSLWRSTLWSFHFDWWVWFCTIWLLIGCINHCWGKKTKKIYSCLFNV